MPSLPAPTILDRIEWWDGLYCAACGRFVDVSWLLIDADPGDSRVPDQGSLCSMCFAPPALPDWTGTLTRLFAYFRRVRDDLRLDALSRQRATLFALSEFRNTELVFEFTVTGFARPAPNPSPPQDEQSYPPHVSLGQFELYPPDTELGRLAHQLGESTTAEIVSVTLGYDVRFRSPRGGSVRELWNPARPADPFGVTIPRPGTLTQRLKLLRRAHAAIHESRRGRPPKIPLERLTAFVMEYRRQYRYDPKKGTRQPFSRWIPTRSPTPYGKWSTNVGLTS